MAARKREGCDDDDTRATKRGRSALTPASIRKQLQRFRAPNNALAQLSQKCHEATKRVRLLKARLSEAECEHDRVADELYYAEEATNRLALFPLHMSRTMTNIVNAKTTVVPLGCLVGPRRSHTATIMESLADFPFQLFSWPVAVHERFTRGCDGDVLQESSPPFADAGDMANSLRHFWSTYSPADIDCILQFCEEGRELPSRMAEAFRWACGVFVWQLLRSPPDWRGERAWPARLEQGIHKWFMRLCGASSKSEARIFDSALDDTVYCKDATNGKFGCVGKKIDLLVFGSQSSAYVLYNVTFVSFNPN